ncbi:FkbM family methyltransferase [Allocoleopsis sp.]|uniref:FkbM family methyltransferase n=1 Tax=Allocoleopsis sp. TaxID=3088169 RepID=UPI002FD166F8
MSNLPKRQPKSKRPDSNKQQTATRDALQQVDHLNQKLQLGIKYCQSGQLQQAEACFQQVLQWQPDNPDACHLLGVIAAQQGHYQTAIEQIQRAIALNSKEATFHHNLGNVYQQSGQFQQAIDCYSKALQLKPDDTEIRKHLDIVYEKQLDLGIEYHQSGKLSQAETCYQQVLQGQPNRADAWHLWGVIACQQEQYSTAIERIHRAIEFEPNAANFYNSLGGVYQKQQCFTDAIACYQKAIHLQPDLAQAYNNLGLAYQEQGMVKQAIAPYRQAIQLQPNYTDAHLNLSIAYEQAGQFELAISSCQKAIELQPNKAEAYVQLGIIFRKQGKLTDAIASYQQALQLNPSSAETYSSLGNALKDQGTLKQAIGSYQRALQLDPSWAVAKGNLISCLHYGSDYKPSEIYAEHRQWAERLAAPLTAAIQPHTNDANPNRRLRIGYVSGDFKTHSVAYFFEPLLAAHNHQDFEIICYANNKNVDVTTQRLRQLADGWREIAFLKDEQVAELIRQDRIDILIDLSGHTADNRLLVFARKPAPIQVTYLGYPNTTGLDTMDYRIVDAWTDPEGQTEHLHTEQLFRLPHGFLCYQPPQDSTAISPPPVLKRGQITFGSFNNLAKVSPQLVGYWAQILKAVPNSRLLIKAKPLVDPGTRNYLQEQFQQQGIDPNRLELVGWLADKTQHLTLYQQVDIALDTFPYHGTTTTCEAMWMGVPVITLAGQAHVSRVGVSLLSSVRLEDLIAQSPEAYIQKAVDLASDLERLQALRANLRDRMAASPLTNASLIVQSVEEAYRMMWQRFCGQTLIGPDELLVTVEGDVKLCVKNDLSNLTTYVLLEQGDWFEPELAFIRKLIIPGMHILDIGANHGVYTLAMAKLLQGQGQVTAYEPASSVVSLLQKSVAANALTTVQIVNAGLSNREGKATLFLAANSELNSCQQSSSHQLQETIQLLTLDGELVKRGWQTIDFIKLDAGGEESKILAGGQRFLTDHTPLVMFEFASGNQSNLLLIQLFQKLGYDIYCLVPAIGCLAPVDVSQPISDQTNLFACKADRARQLTERQLLIREVGETPRSLKPDYWLAAIANWSYAAPFLSQWQQFAVNANAESHLYLAGLNYFAVARAANISLAEQLAALKHSFECLQKAVHTKSSFPRRCTLARVAAELGQRQLSVQTLQELVTAFSSGQTIVIDEPFLPVAQQYDHQPCNDNLSDWLFVSIVQTYESSSVLSSYFAAQRSLSLLTQIVQKPYHSPQAKRRLSYAKHRLRHQEYSLQIYQEDSQALSLGLGNYYSEKNKTLYSSRNNPSNGFFSILSVCFWGMIDLYNLNILPERINFSDEFLSYRSQEQIRNRADFYPYYFKTNLDIKIESNCLISKHDHHGLYRNYNFNSYNLFTHRYFQVNESILKTQKLLVKKYQIDLSKTIAVCYRGTDKHTEVKLGNPHAYLELAEKLLQQNPEHKILIQTDQEQVRDLFVNYFHERCFFFEEMPVAREGRALHANAHLTQVDKFSFGKTLLAVTHLLSQCDLIVNHTGNVAAWICLLRGNADGVFQFDREGKLVVPAQPHHQSQIKRQLQIAQHSPSGQQLKRNEPKFILIKAWGYGFWADVDHVLGQLLIAELTGRIPIVHWGDNSRYQNSKGENAFEHYFQPISPYTIDDLLGRSYKLYPSKWSEDNLKTNELNKLDGSGSRLSGSSFLTRTEDVVVSDFHNYVYDLIPWIDSHHFLAGKSPQEVYRYLFHKYLKLRPEINQDIEQFWSEHLAGHHTFAVHVRGSDKSKESRKIAQINQQYHAVIESYLERRPDTLIFLLTDETSVLEEYKQKYGEKLRYTNAVRTSTGVGIHYQKHASPKQVGIEIIKDTYLAAKCDYFIGNGLSNVSTTILHLKEWGDNQYTLLAKNWLFDTPKEHKPQPQLNLSDTDPRKNQKPETLRQNELAPLEKRLNLGIEHHQAGRLPEAESCYQQVLQWQPNHADAWHLLGVIAGQQKQHQTAIERINRAIELNSENPDFHNNLGNALKAQGKLEEAINAYYQALRVNSRYPDAYYNLGNTFKQQGKLEQAIDAYQQALKLNPKFTEVHNNLGNVLAENGKLEEAISCYQQALQLNPNNVEICNNIGNALKEQGRLQDAVISFQQILQLRPDYADAHYNLGNTLKDQGKLQEAIACYQRTLQLNPNFEKAHNNLGNALQDQGKLKEAIACYQRALQLNPYYKVAQDNLVFALYYSNEYQPSEIYAEHRKWAERIVLLITEPIQPHSNNTPEETLRDRNPKRRLRIGYVSGDFKTHSVSYFFEPLLAAHNQRDFEIICYANNRKADTKTQQLRQLAHGWREIYTLTDEQVTQLIRQDEIDILVDLSGHTADNRLLVFARKPAPVQVSYIGYPGTTALNAINYRLTDAWADPPGKTEHLYTEELVHLPHGFLCYQPPQDCPSVSPLPALEKRQITFGSFNNLAKVSPPLVAYWSEILKAVPNSRLLLKFKSLIDPGTRDYLRGLFQEQGIGSERLELMGWAATQSEHLSLYNQVDIALDTFPYHGTTTTCEALWMGVPMITLAGQTHVSRVGVSLLHSVGLEELIAHSPQEYIQKAVALANNLEELQELRANLRRQMQAAPLTNASLIAQSLEDAYRTMWRCWCNGN